MKKSLYVDLRIAWQLLSVIICSVTFEVVWMFQPHILAKSCCLLHSVSKEEGHIYMANINLIQSPFTSSLHSQVPNPCPNSNYTFKTRTQKKCERCKKIKILHHTVGLKMLLTKIALFSMVSSHRWLLCLEEELQPATLTHTHTFSECILVAVLSNFMAVTPLGDVRKL